MIEAQTHLETLYRLDSAGRIASTREPDPSHGPLFAMVLRGESSDWALRDDVDGHVAEEIARLVAEESGSPLGDSPPNYADRIRELIARSAKTGEWQGGPAFEFPPIESVSSDVVRIDGVEALSASFSGWTAEELPERSPILSIALDGRPVSICFCARSAEKMAEAGVETLPEYRGRGYAGEVTKAWAVEILRSGRTPIYSTSLTNSASLSVARKLGLKRVANYWSLSAPT